MYDYFSLYYHVFRFQIIHSKCISTHSVIHLTVHIYLKLIMGKCRRGAPIRPKPNRPKPIRPKMIGNYRKIVLNITKTIPNPTPNPNRLLQQYSEVNTSPNSIILLVTDRYSFGLMGFGLLGFGLMGAHTAYTFNILG